MKEKTLTVMVPITDNDATVVQSLPAVDPANINVIYKHNGLYKRVWLNPSTNIYEYHTVVDREFPYLGNPLEIYYFSYNATRMGTAPTITAQDVMWCAYKDSNGNDVTLDDLWYQWFDYCHVYFNGERFYLKEIPKCTKDNNDVRYKYDIDFVSERFVLEKVYLYDIVQPFITEKPISESLQFPFFGDIKELAKRINASMLRSGISKILFRTNEKWTLLREMPSDWVVNWRNYYSLVNGQYVKLSEIFVDTSPAFIPNTYYKYGHPRYRSDGETLAEKSQFFTYEEWNSIGLGTYQGPLSVEDVYIGYTESERTNHTTIFDHYGGDYNSYLRNEVYLVDDDGEFVMSGYICKIGQDKKGEPMVSDEKLIVFDKKYIHQALQEFKDTFGLQYYIYSETNLQGEYTGNIIIMVGDCQHDFADMNQSGTDYERDEEGIPTTTHPLDYGYDNELLSKEKINTKDGIITRITGIGSEENIPWYYPNPTADGWIKPIYMRGEDELSNMVVYPQVESDSSYDKYLKNRLGYEYIFKKLKDLFLLGTDSAELSETTAGGIYRLAVSLYVSNDETFHFEAKELKNIFNDSAPQITIFKKNDNDEYVYVAAADEATLHLTEYTAGDYKITFSFAFGSTKPVGETFEWYYVETPMVAANTGLLIDASKVSLEEVLSIFAWAPNQHFYSTSSIIWTYQKDGELKLAYNSSSKALCNAKGFFAVYDIDDWNPSGRVKYLDLTQPDGGWDGKFYKVKIHNNIISYKFELAPDLSTIYSDYIHGRFGTYIKRWTSNLGINSTELSLGDFGLSLSGNAQYGDVIKFQRLKYVTPQPNLMPEVYIKTDGERRYYDAKNYPLNGVDPDPMVGEEYQDGQTINPIYFKDDTDTHYHFENEYLKLRPREHSETFDDVKPTIKGQINTSGGQSFRIDVVEQFAYDELDDDDVWENDKNGNINGEYKHPYFFAKLRPLGFNIFDLALQEDMVLSITTGHCGSCKFKIGVDENTKKNPVQIWEYDVYEGSSWSEKTFRYNAGEIRRIVDTSILYYDTNGQESGYVQVDDKSFILREGFIVGDDFVVSRNTIFQREVYSSDAVKNGMVGSLKQGNKTHFYGDVKTSGKFIDSQQDTTDNYVWIALMKDTDTFGVIMPSARPDYSDGNYSVYIRPKSISDVHTLTSTPQEDEENADKFVLTNIRLPQIYLRRAERELSRRIVSYMYDNNYQKFNFSIKFSKIFLSDNQEIDDKLNENSVIYVNFNNRIYRQYIKNYTCRISKDEAFHEIEVDMNEELSVSRTKVENDNYFQNRISNNTNRRIRSIVSSMEGRIMRNTIGRNSDTLVGGNIVNRDSVTSLVELQDASKKTESSITENHIDLEVNHYRKGDFVLGESNLSIGEDISVPSASIFDSLVSSVNIFNTNVASRIMQIRYTMENRLGLVEEGNCSISPIQMYKVYDYKDQPNTAFWVSSSGEDVSTKDVCPAIFVVSWTNFEPIDDNT